MCLAAINMVVVLHSPYLSDLAPWDFFLFLRMKSQLQERYFQDLPEIHEQL
jgi:hypothetical protein